MGFSNYFFTGFAAGFPATGFPAGFFTGAAIVYSLPDYLLTYFKI
jgi:hypothetical protein